MSDFIPESAEFRADDKVRFMSSVAEASHLLRRVAEPRPVGDSIKAAITRAARRCGLRPGRAEDLWRCEARQVKSEEMDAIRRAAAIKWHNEEAKARNELAELRGRITRLEALLMAGDQDFHSPTIAGAREQARQADRSVGALDCTLDRE